MSVEAQGLAIQGLGWFVRRAAASGDMVRFYRDVLGLGDLRSGEHLAMLWAGGVTVFEPNQGGGHSAPGARPEEAQVLPVFGAREPETTLQRLGLETTPGTDGLWYLQDPAGNWLALEKRDDKHDRTPVASLPDDLVGLKRVILRSRDPKRQATDLAAALGLALSEETLNLGCGVIATFRDGAAQASSIGDREAATDALVFRTYDLQAVKTHMERLRARSIGDVSMPGGDIRYFQDAFGLVFGFQERRVPAPGVPTSWLPEDMHARTLWDGTVYSKPPGL